MRHDIAFNEDGSLTLTIKYQAALTGLATSPGTNIFAAGTQENNIVKLRDKLKAKRAADEDYDTTKDLEAIDKLEQEDRKEKYSKLLRGVYKTGKVYTLKVPVKQMLVPNLAKMPQQERRAMAYERSEVKLASPTTAGKLQKDVLTSLGTAKTPEEVTAAAQKSSQKRYEEFMEKTATDTVDVNYIYLGDLLEAILANLPGNPIGGKAPFSFFLADVEFIDILRTFRLRSASLKTLGQCADPAAAAASDAFQKANPHLALQKNKLFRLMNIGDIPISLDAFQAFFLRNVVDKERDKYYFLHLVKDLCSQLITKALRTTCYGNGGTFKLLQRFDTQPISLYTTAFGPSTTVDAVAKAKSQLGCHITDATKFGMGMVVVSTDSKHRNLRGKFKPDLRKGIYHHYIGAPCSLMKKLNFQREDQPYLRESKIQKNGALGAEQLRELYSVSIDLVGNNLYRNGSYIYVSPMLINTTQAQLNYLGLHGYFLVTSVSSELTEKSFSTSIKALQEGIPFVTDKPEDSSANTDKPATPAGPSTGTPSSS